jgi:hypothetical protein
MSFLARHNPVGNERLCSRCDLPQWLHEKPRNRKVYYRQRDSQRDFPPPRDRIIGIDGEGQGNKPHRYRYLAAVDEEDQTWCVSNDAGLTVEQCFDFLLGLPPRSLCFGYAFVYDLTKICQGLPDGALYELFHEETRARIVEGRVIYRPVKWRGYSINYMNRRFTLSRGSRRITVWDIFRFFASKFTGALIDWQVADKAKLERMAEMKEKRGNGDEWNSQTLAQLKVYCDEECGYLAKLGRKLIAAHDDAGIKLKSYFGAGSTASALLDKLGIVDKRGDIPEAMRVGIASAFFGGRFENSIVGPVSGPIYDYDISSAYPYHASLLPCLLCGQWSHYDHLDAQAELAAGLVRWSCNEGQTWGALPVRAGKEDPDNVGPGTIRFPLAAAGGWSWLAEFKAAQRFNLNVVAREAWVYRTDCDHRPFADVPTYYRERVKLGKDAKGLVLKLGMNSVYGKLAQSKGVTPRYQSWVWAGMITAGCRGQLLDAMARAPDRRDILVLATDGIKSRCKLRLDPPVDTGTGDLPKPLGGWEEKVMAKGMFVVRPGIFFPLDPTADELEKVRARGLGRKLLYEQWEKVVDAWEAHRPTVKLTGVSRFIGAKSGFSVAKGRVKRSPDLGEWVSYPVDCSFNPRPKRCGVNRDGTLRPWDYVAQESTPYDRAMLSPEAALMRLAEKIAEEQPDTDFADMEGDE